MKYRKQGIAVFLLLTILLSVTSVSAASLLNIRKEGPCMTAHKTASYTKTELHAVQGDKDIYGFLYYPSTCKRQVPVVILSHGVTATHTSVEKYAEKIAEHGYAAYVFDYCGGGAKSQSTGSTTDMSLLTEEKDLELVLSMIRKQKGIDREQIYLMGASQGGAVSAMTAADHTDEIAGLILLYPGFNIPDFVRSLCPSKEVAPETFELLGMQTGKRYITDVYDMDIYAEIKPYEKDVLILHGDVDEIVPYSYSQKAVKEYKSAELVTIHGAGHGFDGSDFDTVIKCILEYLQKAI